MKKLIYILFFLFCSSTLFAQNKIDSALQNLKNGELKKAGRLIDAAKQHPQYQDSAAT